MPLFSSLLRWMTGRPHTRRTLARKPTPRFRPQLETLEGRDLPSFGTPVAYSAYATQALATADMNGDGKPDLVSLYEGNAVAVRLNNGDGTFGSAFSYPVHQTNSDALAVSVRAGFPPQILVATDPGDGGSFGQTDGISVLQFNSNGTFTETTYDNVFPTSARITSLATADFSGKGTLDVVVTGSAGDVYVASLVYNNHAVQTYYVPAGAFPGPTRVAVGDFNGDGKPDFVVADAGIYASGTWVSGDIVSVFLNNGDGTFAAAQSYTVWGSPTPGAYPPTTTAVAVGDFNHDGKLDIVATIADGTVSVLLNNGNGAFGAAQNYAISGPANSIAVGDFNHDGFPDVVTTGAEMDLLLNNGNGTFGAYQPVGPAGSNVVADDFVSPGFFDLAQIDASHNSIDVLLNNADPTVSLSFGSITYNKKTHLYSETVTLTNISSGPLTGPLSLELTNLPSGVVLTDATGTTNGNPYVRFLTSGKTLRKGASVSITLTFTAPSLSDITFGTEVVVL
jgi:hypothetical protein